MRKLVVAIFAINFCVTVVSHAQSAPTAAEAQPRVRTGTDETINRHLGFFLRPDLGAGYMNTSWSSSSLSGAAGVFGFAIGGAVQENLILAGHVWDGVVVNPKYSGSLFSSSTSNTTLTMWGIGPELTYYLMPANVYFSGTASLTQLTQTVYGRDYNTNVGFGGRLSVGKEWWVSDHWGLGVVAHASASWNRDKDSPTTLTTWSGAVAFSATYN